MFRFSLKNSLVLIGCVVLSASILCGQDLGSSNKLFGASKNSGKTKSDKKPVEKSKITPAKAKSTTSKTSSAAKQTVKKAGSPAKKPAATPRNTSADKTKFTEFKKVQPAKFEITVAKPNLATSSNKNEERYEDLIVAGNDARDDRNYSVAEKAYKTARVLKPKDARATYGLGNLYSDQQRWEEAETLYRAALLLEPNSVVAHIALSYVLTQPIAAPDLSDRYDEAEKLAQKAIQMAPANALAFDQLGVALELRGLIGAETENAYRKAIKLDPAFAPSYAHLGRLLRRRGLLKESAQAYENAIKRSTDVATMILVADVMQSEQRYVESERLLQSALDADPRNPAAMLLMGRALTAQGKFADAERVLRSALNTSSNGFAANSLLGSLYTRQGNFELAEGALEAALKFVSSLEKRGLSQQFESVGDGFMKMGNRSRAERAYRQAISLDSESQSLVGKLVRAQKG